MYKQSEIVLVPFPYSDLSYTKKRPVLIVSNNEYNLKYPDVIVVVITSVKHEGDKYSIPLLDKDLEYGVLLEKSFIKIHKLFTISKQKIIKKFSKIREEKFIKVYNIVVELFKIEESGNKL